jgi:nucleotide-binding universal stress UspA family protein
MLAARTRAVLTVAHMIELPPEMPEFPQPDWSAYRAARFTHARAAMATALTSLAPACQVQELVLAGSAAAEILRLAAEQQTDLIVMGVHGCGEVDPLLCGSVTQHIVRRANCPVLAVPTVSLVPHQADAGLHTAGCAGSASRWRSP